MIYIETGSTDVYYNFGLEYYFTLEKRLPDTVFLFWRTTPTLMVGKYQNVLEEINKPYADARGIHLVRRMSGGGTIYTDMGGWQFTFIQHKEAGEIEFGQYIAPVIDALREMGVRADFNGRNDLTIDGKKFSGNAQYRLGDCIVHHGSLLFDTDIAQMVASTTVDSYKITSKSIKSVRDRVTNISEHLPGPMDAETFKETMVRHIMNGSTATYTVTPEDDARIREIAREQFQSWERIFGRSPKFTIAHSLQAALPAGRSSSSWMCRRGLSGMPPCTATSSPPWTPTPSAPRCWAAPMSGGRCWKPSKATASTGRYTAFPPRSLHRWWLTEANPISACRKFFRHAVIFSHFYECCLLHLFLHCRIL